MSGNEKSRKALLVLDIQEDFTGPKARMPVEAGQAGKMIANVNVLSSGAMRIGMTVIYIKNAFSRFDFIGNIFRNHASIKDSPGSAFDARLIIVGDTIFEKSQPDAFTNRDFERFMANRGIDELYITGVFADQCVLSTSKSAIRRGFKVNYISDAVASTTADDVDRAIAKIRKFGASIRETQSALSSFPMIS